MFSRILMVCLLLCSKQTFCQTNYFDSIKLMTNSFFATSILNDSMLLSVGAGYDTIFGYRLVFNKFDESGQLQFTKNFKILNKSHFARKIIKKNEKYYVFGTVEEPSFTNPLLFLACFNNNLENEWLQYYGGNYFNDGEDFKATLDNGFILGGQTTENQNSENQAYLVKTDSLGNVEWERTYGGSRQELVYSVIQTFDESYIFSGQTNSYSLDQKSDFYIVKVNSLGDTLWSKKYGENMGENVCFVTQTTDSSIIVTGSYRFLDDNNDLQFKGICMKINQFSGELIWQKQHLLGTYTNFFHAAIVMEDNSIVVSGGVKHGDDTQLATIFKFDSIGNYLWHREYFTRTDIDQYFYDVIATKDGGFALCGSAHDTSNFQRAWVVKVDCYGYDSLHYYYKDSICNIEDCIRYAEDANFTINADSLEFLQNQALVVNNTSQDATLFWDFGDGFTIENETSVTHTYLQEGSYNVQLIFEKGMCSDTTIKTIFVGAGLGIDPLMSDFGYAQPSFRIYPNPNSGSFFIENNTGDPLDFKLTDAQGKLIFEQNIHSQLENIHLELEKGIYFVTFGEQVDKMVVK